MRFLEYLTEAESQVKQQMLAIRDGKGEWEQQLKKWITGEEAPFTYSGARNFRVATPKQIPNDIKKKYPDVIFALQALTKHLGASGYYDKWQEAQKYLTFKPDNKPRTFYRFWNIKEEQLQQLRKKQNITLDTSRSVTSSYTYNKSLWRKAKDSLGGGKVLSLSTEPLLQTHGQALTLVTKHTFTPTFNLAYFIFHVMNAAKQVFGKNIFEYGGYGKEYGSGGFSTLRAFAHEREVIGPAISEIKPSDVVGYYKMGTFNELYGKEYQIRIKPGQTPYTFLEDDIAKLKAKLKEHGGTLDMSLFNNRLILVTDPEKSHMGRYARGQLFLNKALTKLLGAKIYLGHWA